MNRLQTLVLNAQDLVAQRKLREANADHCGFVARALMLLSIELDGDREAFTDATYGSVDHADLLQSLLDGCERSPSPLHKVINNVGRVLDRRDLLEGRTEHIGTVARALSELARSIDGDIEHFDEAMLGEVDDKGIVSFLLKGVCRPAAVV